MPNNVTKKELDYAAGVNTSDLAAKKVIALKAQVDKLDIDKLVNVATSLFNLKTKVNDLNVGKLKKFLYKLFSDYNYFEHKN